MNTCNYDILLNRRYADSFLYTVLENRFENANSDMVAQIIMAGEDQVNS